MALAPQPQERVYPHTFESNILDPDEIEKIRREHATTMSDAQRATVPRSSGPEIKNVDSDQLRQIVDLIAAEVEKIMPNIEAALSPEQLAAQTPTMRWDIAWRSFSVIYGNALKTIRESARGQGGGVGGDAT